LRLKIYEHDYIKNPQNKLSTIRYFQPNKFEWKALCGWSKNWQRNWNVCVRN